MTRWSTRIVLMAFATALAAGPAWARVGVTSVTDGDPLGQPPAEPERVLRVGIDVQANERITTRADDRAHVVFLDGTALTIGPNSVLVIDKYVYDPDRKAGDIALNVTRGTFRFVGGAISKNNEVTIKTPSATIGIRGGIVTFSVSDSGRDHRQLPVRRLDARDSSGFHADGHAERIGDHGARRSAADAADPHPARQDDRRATVRAEQARADPGRTPQLKGRQRRPSRRRQAAPTSTSGPSSTTQPSTTQSSTIQPAPTSDRAGLRSLLVRQIQRPPGAATGPDQGNSKRRDAEQARAGRRQGCV